MIPPFKNPQSAIRNRQTHSVKVGLTLWVKLLPCAILAFVFVSLLAQSQSSGPVLSITLTNLDDYALQPVAGQWNPITREIRIPPGGSSSQFLMFCGPTVAVSWIAQTNTLYECQASTDERNWLGSAMRIFGVGRVTMYDAPGPRRFYRVLATPQ